MFYNATNKGHLRKLDDPHVVYSEYSAILMSACGIHKNWEMVRLYAASADIKFLIYLFMPSQGIEDSKSLAYTEKVLDKEFGQPVIRE